MSNHTVVANVSRDSRRPSVPNTPTGNGSVTQRRPAGHPITCNRCRKPLSTTVFICSCDCAFCEECTYSHFDTSSNCPVCNRVLSENDFTEVVVADLSSATSNRTTNFQGYFTKQNASAPFLAFQDYCSRLLKQVDDVRSGSKFMMKQFLLGQSKQAQQRAQTQDALRRQQQEITFLKQKLNSKQLEIENYQKQLKMERTKQSEMERQLMQFRQIVGNRTPEAPTGHPVAVSGGGGRSSSPRGQHGSSSHANHGQQPPAPPIRGFMIQKEAQQRARQQEMQATQASRPVLGASRQHQSHGHNTSQRPSSYSGSASYATPPAYHQGNNRPHSTGSGGSVGIRNLSSNSGFAFSGGANKRRRQMSPGDGRYRMQSPSQGGALSPSQAFHMQQRGSTGPYF